MNRFYIITNSEKDRGLKTTGEIHDYLKARGCQCVVREYQGQEELPEGTHFKYTTPPGFRRGQSASWFWAATAL